MERVCNKARTFEEAEEQDLLYYVRMTVDERQELAKELREKVYGEEVSDVRDVKKVQKR